ncbi:hypothetical protein AB0M95_18550 [Sphaerisporangium sp. NPDC051017]|uniref:hypothetical protein n=1 Tax=Sphaerisporangium sp. NPDC051017 TaxID=3154636 RepID=UPI00341F022A
MTVPGDGPVCPSADARPGATLLGILGPRGRVVFLPQGPRVTEDLLAGLAATSSPVEARHRFAAPCVARGCAFWDDGRCRAADVAAAEFPRDNSMAELPECGIRDRCRWFFQSGAEACRVCVHVTTAAVSESAGPVPSV